MLTETETIREEAYSAFNAQHFDLAIQECMKAITSHSYIPWPYYLIGIILATKGDDLRGLAYLKRYLDLDTARFSQSRKRASRIVRQLEEKTKSGGA